jgi:cystathionine beta-lyase/cystathionine gamma-synthase
VRTVFTTSFPMVYLEDPSQLAFASISLHADDGLSPSADVAPAINVSTTFIQSGDPANPSPHIYSRQSSETRNRVEQVLGLLNKGHAITYSSGLSAGYAGLLHVKPNRVAIRGGYHGTHGFIEIYKRHRDIVRYHRVCVPGASNTMFTRVYRISLILMMSSKKGTFCGLRAL